MPWHFAEHLVGMHWARPERANCSRAHEPPRRAPVLAHTAGPRHALPASPQHDSPPWRPTAPPPEHFWRHAGVGRQPCAVQRRPSHPGSPPGPLNSSSSSTSVSPSSRRRHVPCSYRTAVRRPPYPPPRNRPRRAIKGTPSPSEHARNLKLPPWNPHSPQSSGKRRLLHLRQLLPPPLSRSLRRHQGFPLPILFTKNPSFHPGTQPPT